MSDTIIYNIVQTVFMLAMAAGSASGVDDTQANLEAALAVALNGGTLPNGVPFVGFFPSTNSALAGGDWSVVWGPAVFTPPPIPPATTGFAANAMYVAYSPSQATYVVAIAGTNFNSTYDLDQEDENVTAATMAQFPFDVPFVETSHAVWTSNPPPAVSAGTAVGISNLLTQMTDPTTGSSLQTFLNRAATTAAALIFCGHSLGGALAGSVSIRAKLHFGEILLRTGPFCAQETAKRRPTISTKLLVAVSVARMLTEPARKLRWDCGRLTAGPSGSRTCRALCSKSASTNETYC